MTLSQLADVGELQIRPNTRSVPGSTLHQNTHLWSERLFHLGEPEVSQAYVAGMTGRAEIRAPGG